MVQGRASTFSRRPGRFSQRFAACGSGCSDWGPSATAQKDRAADAVGSPLIPRVVHEAKGKCDFLALYFHDGIEAFPWPTKTVMDLAHSAAGWGLDFLVGTHPHTVQGIEVPQGVPIAYSVGDFIMPLMVPDLYEKWRSQEPPSRRWGFPRQGRLRPARYRIPL